MRYSLLCAAFTAALLIGACTPETDETFSLSVTSVEVPPTGGEFTVSVTGKMPYHLNPLPDWIEETAVEKRTHTFKASINPSDESRSDVLVFCDEGGVCLPLTVNQGGSVTWASATFRHQSLLMRFTATWCGWCPLMNNSVKKAQETYPGKIQHLAIHGTGSSLLFPSANILMNLYDIAGFPTGILDGRIEIENDEIPITSSKIVAAARETENKYGTVSGARIRSSVEGNQLKIDMRLFLKASGLFKVTVFVVEDGIDATQKDYIDGDHKSYIHDNVARLAVTPVLGEEFTQKIKNKTHDFNWTATLDDNWSKENLRILAYVQTKFGERKKISTADYGDFYVDNCFTVKAGENLELETL